MKTAVEIYKLLPRTNCGKCGVTSCFGFAAKTAAKLSRITDCPDLSERARREAASWGEETDEESPGTAYRQALLSLLPKVKALDFRKVAALFGAALAGDALTISFLNERFIVTREKAVGPSGKESRPWISILIYNHLTMPDPPAPSGEWITFSAVPAAHAKDKAWAGHVEEVIAKRFSGDVPGLRAECRRMGGTAVDVKGSHDAAFSFLLFPHYPALLLFYDAVLEEGFPAQCTLLLDRTAPRYLDIESMVVLGEEFAARLTGGANSF